MSFTVVEWHHSANEDSDDDPCEHEERANPVDSRESAVTEQDNAAAEPGHDLIDDEDLPAFNFHFWVVKLITVKNSIANDGGVG